MGDRNLVVYEEERLSDGPHHKLEIARSASGAPGLFFTITVDMADSTLTHLHREETIVVKDGLELLAPVLRWLLEDVTKIAPTDAAEIARLLNPSDLSPQGVARVMGAINR